jgi:hypothetical protein
MTAVSGPDLWFLYATPGQPQSIFYAIVTILRDRSFRAPVRQAPTGRAPRVADGRFRPSLRLPGQVKGTFVMTPMNFARGMSDYRIIVRRVAIGSAPYRWGWEVREATGNTQVHISPERFRDMEAAYQAGKAWLGAVEPVSGARPATSSGPYKTKARPTAVQQNPN